MDTNERAKAVKAALEFSDNGMYHFLQLLEDIPGDFSKLIEALTPDLKTSDRKVKDLLTAIEETDAAMDHILVSIDNCVKVIVQSKSPTENDYNILEAVVRQRFFRLMKHDLTECLGRNEVTQEELDRLIDDEEDKL